LSFVFVYLARALFFFLFFFFYHWHGRIRQNEAITCLVAIAKKLIF
jgi:hypothetical protein